MNLRNICWHIIHKDHSKKKENKKDHSFSGLTKNKYKQGNCNSWGMWLQGVDYLKYDNCYHDGSKPQERLYFLLLKLFKLRNLLKQIFLPLKTTCWSYATDTLGWVMHCIRLAGQSFIPYVNGKLVCTFWCFFLSFIYLLLYKERRNESKGFEIQK